MRRSGWVLCLAAVSAAPALLAGCSDLGDSYALPGDDAGSSSSSSLDAAMGSRGDARGVSDAKRADRSEPGSTPDATSGEGPDSSAGGGADSSEATGLDSQAPEASPSSMDSGIDGAQESGVDSTVGAGSDAHADTGPDSPAEVGADSPEDSQADVAPDSPEDTGADSPADTGQDGPPGLLPCTVAGQTDCVQCQGNATNLCSPTEAAFVQHDIDTHVATTAGPDPDNPNFPSMGSCYACLLAGGCIDDTTFSDVGHECEDDSPPFSFLAGTTTAECQAVLSCILGSGNGISSCASAAVSGCYCGTAAVSTACQGDPAAGPINGACATEIATGLDFPVSDGTDNTKNLTDITKGAGRATQVFQCAQSNSCAACL
jgi:hypothetical protein